MDFLQQKRKRNRKGEGEIEEKQHHKMCSSNKNNNRHNEAPTNRMKAKKEALKEQCVVDVTQTISKKNYVLPIQSTRVNDCVCVPMIISLRVNWLIQWFLLLICLLCFCLNLARYLVYTLSIEWSELKSVVFMTFE